MSDPNKIAQQDVMPSSFISRVLANDALKKGVAGAVAGILVSVAIEALFPSEG